MRLNVGCGPYHMLGWTNLDLLPNGTTGCGYENANSHVDIVADAENMPLEDESVDEIYCGHFMEHIPMFKTQPLFGEFKRVLKPHGKLTVITPDFRKICSMFMRGQCTVDQAFYYFILGIGDYDKQEHLVVSNPPHQRCFEQDTMYEEFTKAGFYGIVPVDIFTNPYVVSRIDVQSGFEAYKLGAKT